jgi:4-diphosphocytidyl-2-C-methyl-D-erythritol kinase
VVKEVPVGRAFDIVLAKPPMGLSTAAVFRELGTNFAPKPPQDSRVALEALRSGDVEMLARSLQNRLQEPAMKLCPPVADLYRRMQATGAAGCLMSGSGSCLFALCREQREAERVSDDLRRGWLSEDETARARVFHVKSCICA